MDDIRVLIMMLVAFAGVVGLAAIVINEIITSMYIRKAIREAKCRIEIKDKE